MNGPEDWDSNIYFNCSSNVFMNGKIYRPAEACGVPFSCCRNESTSDAFLVSNTQCGYNIRRKDRIFWGEIIWIDGCTSKFAQWIKNNYKTVVVACMTIGFIQVNFSKDRHAYYRI